MCCMVWFTNESCKQTEWKLNHSQVTHLPLFFCLVFFVTDGSPDQVVK